MLPNVNVKLRYDSIWPRQESTVTKQEINDAIQNKECIQQTVLYSQ